MTYKQVGTRPISQALGIQQACSILDAAAKKAIADGDVDSMLSVVEGWLAIASCTGQQVVEAGSIKQEPGGPDKPSLGFVGSN